TWSPVTVPIYALLEGLFLGAISSMFEQMYPGIVIQAVGLTFGTLFALLFAYKSGLIKATENFKLGVVAATGAVALIYMASIVLSFFGTSIPYIHESGTIGILFSLAVVVIAALNLVLDFDFIETGAERGAPKYMEWYGAFGLLVTLIWLYLEMLRLLSKLNSRR
ncbi:MAG TPA: Bax inhibitor-1/YccA family protein, partial [Vicinamibacteria bacterium]